MTHVIMTTIDGTVLDIAPRFNVQTFNAILIQLIMFIELVVYDDNFIFRIIGILSTLFDLFPEESRRI